MIGLDPHHLSPEVTALLLRRGAGVPSLYWTDRPDRGAKDILDRLEDSSLLGKDAVVDEGMLAGVRALLHLWNGSLDDAQMFAQAAAPSECEYITGLCARHRGDAAAAKEAFQRLEGHRVFDLLYAFALEQADVLSDALLVRFVGVVKLGEAWEPHAFIDLLGQVRAGKGGSQTETIVATMQAREFELLLEHCYRGAGGKIAEQPKAVAQPRRRPVARKSRHAARSAPSSGNSASLPSDGPAEAAHRPAPKGVGIYCPKCREINILPESARGGGAICKKCSAKFLVPKATAPSA